MNPGAEEQRRVNAPEALVRPTVKGESPWIARQSVLVNQKLAQSQVGASPPGGLNS